MDFTRPVPVSVFIELLNTQLNDFQAKIFGEVSGLKKAASGHVYFDLKDSDGTLSCAIWKFKYQISGIDLQEGMQIIASGKPNIYAPNGRLSFIADTIEYSGEGELKKAYDQLYFTLEAEGLFAESRKRSLPPYIKKIGVITSRHGAVIHDFENNLGQWGFQLKFIDARVEGKESVLDLIHAIRTMRKQDIDVLVLMRGGGSRASLAAFDNEMLVREIAHFPVPVIAGIGHHEDVPLAVLAADLAVSTPTAAAHAVNSSWDELIHSLQSSEQRILQSFTHHISVIRQYLHSYQSGIIKTFNAVQKNGHKRLTEQWVVVRKQYDADIQSITERLRLTERVIKVNDPQRLLNLGYSVVRNNGRVVKKSKHARINDVLEIQVSDGVINSKVTKND